jgi:hypothetical protein
VTSRLHATGGLAGAALVPGAAARIGRSTMDAGEEAAIADLLQTLRARPDSLPQVPEDLAAMQAAARLQLAAMVEDEPTGSVDLVIGSGRTLAAAPTAAGAARMLLEGVRPVGVTQLAVDPASVLGPIGSLGDDELREALALLGDDVLAPLGTAIVTRGGAPGGLAMRATVHRAGWPTQPPVSVRVGQLQVIALGRGQEAEVSIEPGPGVTLGSRRRAPRITARVTGGSVGLILDGRGTPIPLPRRGDDRRAVLAGWRDALGRDAEAVA